jgi:hypothetical protein
LTNFSRTLCPEFFFSGLFHYTLTLGTCALIPNPDIIAATIQTESPNFASVGWSHVGNDASNHNVLDGLAVRATHWGNLLVKKTAPLIHLGFIPASLTAIF